MFRECVAAICCTSREQTHPPQINSLVLYNYKSISSHEGTTYPRNMYPHHFHVWALVVILSLLHVPLPVPATCPATRPCYMSPLHVPATCPRYTSLLHVPLPVPATCPRYPSLLHVPLHVPATCPVTRPCYMSPLNVPATCLATRPCYMSATRPCYMSRYPSLLHVPATRPCYMSHQSALHTFFVAARCPCNMTPRVSPPLQYSWVIKLFECLRSAHTEGLVPGIKSLRVNYPFSLENLVAGTKIWCLRLVPSNLCWSLRLNCSWDKSLRPNEKLTNHVDVNIVFWGGCVTFG